MLLKFPFLEWLLWLYWMAVVKMGILVLFLILEKSFQSFKMTDFFLNWPLSCWESSLFFLVFYNSFCFYSLLEVVSWSLQQFCRTISVFKAVSVCFMYFVSGIYQLWLLYSLEDAIGFRMCFNLINVQFNYYNC